MSGPRRLLVLLLVLGSLGNLGGGTTASFTASTSNPAADFATGTLVLGNDVEGQGVCYSTDDNVPDTQVDAGNANACDTITPVNLMKPGDEVAIDLDIVNDGSLPGTLSLYATGACTSGADPDAAYTGTGDLCEAVQMNIQEWSDPARTPNTHEVECIYGGVDDVETDTCAFDTWGEATPLTLEHFTANHVAPGDDPTTPILDLGAIAEDGQAGATRYFTISFAIDLDVDNTYQGREAAWGLTWLVEQAS